MLKKKVFALLMSLAMIVTMIPMIAAPAFASEALKKYDDFTIGNLSYTVISTSGGWKDAVGRVAVRKADNLKASEITGTIVIPESVVYNGNRYFVNEIQEYAFKDCKNLKSVIVAGTKQSYESGYCAITIGDGAFLNCSGLNNFTTFQKEFQSFDDLKVKPFEGVGTKAHRCYFNVSDLYKKIGQNPDQLKYINMLEALFAEEHTGEVTDFEWKEWNPDSKGGGYFITRYVSPLSLPQGCQDEVKNLINTLAIPNQIKSTDPETYTLVYFGFNIRTDGDYAISCPDHDIASKITDVVISEGIESIGTNTDWECKFGDKYGINGIVLPSSMKALRDYAFQNFNTKSITFNKGIESVGYGILAGCETLQKVTFKTTPYFIDENGDKIMQMSEGAFDDMNTKKKATLILPTDWFGPTYTIYTDYWCGGRFNLYLNPSKCPKLVVKKYGKRSFKLSWKKISGAKLYVAQCTKKGKKLTTSNETSKNTYIFNVYNGKRLKKGTKYKMRVLAYNKYGTLIGKSAIVIKKR